MVTKGFEQKLIRSIFFRRFFISTFVIVALLACAGKEMSVEEAKKVTPEFYSNRHILTTPTG